MDMYGTQPPKTFSKQIKRQLQIIEIGCDGFSEIVKKAFFFLLVENGGDLMLGATVSSLRW